MSRAFRQLWKRLPAIALLLLFIGDWLTVPLSLVSPEPITCGMECCEESGECCCFLSRQAMTHEEGDTEQEAQLASFQKGCQSNCASPPSFSTHALAQKKLPSLLRLELIAHNEPHTHQASNRSRLELCRKSAPRAPPIFS